MNRVLKNELKLSTRTIKTSIIIFAFNGILVIGSLIILFKTSNDTLNYNYVNYNNLLFLYKMIGYMEFIILMLLVPAITATAITGERDRKTLDLLLVTRMKPRDIIVGKLLASLSTIVLLIVASTPILFLTFVYGGISVMDVIITIGVLMICAFFVGSIGILCSTICKKTSTALVSSYSIILGIILGGYGIVMFAQYIVRGNEMVQNSVNSLSGLIYLLLPNPAITFYGAICNQVGSFQVLKNFLQSLGANVNSAIIDVWIPVSIVVQILLSFLFIGIAAWKINPIRKKPFSS